MRTARHDQVADGDLHRFVVRIQRGCPDLDDTLIRTRLRGAYLEHNAFDAKFVARPNGSRPAQFVEACADDAAGGSEIAVDQELHRDRGGVPAARRETAEQRADRGPFIEMERLGIEFGGKALDAFGLDADATGAKGLSGLEVFEESLGVVMVFS